MSSGFQVSDELSPRIAHAQREIRTKYDHVVNFLDPARGINKFGRNRDINGTRETVWEIGGDEVYQTSNTIDSIVADDAADTQQVFLEGFTVSGAGFSQKFTRVEQVVTLNGTTPVSLPIPLARAERMYNVGTADFAGTVYVYRSAGATVIGGVPSPAGNLHLTMSDLDQQSFKAAITVPDETYFVMTTFEGSIRKTTSAAVDIQIQTREVGRVFRTRYEISMTQATGTVEAYLDPPIIVTPNSDVRLLGSASTTNVEINGGFSGYYGEIYRG